MYLASKVMLLIEGAMVLCLIHRHEKWFDIAEQAAMTLLTNPGADDDNFGPTGTPDPRPGRSAP